MEGAEKGQAVKIHLIRQNCDISKLANFGFKLDKLIKEVQLDDIISELDYW